MAQKQGGNQGGSSSGGSSGSKGSGERGFAAMDDQQQREIARKGGEAAARQNDRDEQGQFTDSKSGGGSGSGSGSSSGRGGSSGGSSR